MKRLAGLILAALVGSCPVFAADAPAQTGQHPQTFDKQIEVKLDYLLYLPPSYGKEADKKWPLIVFLHGSGERGGDVNKVKIHGPPKIAEAKDSPLEGRFIVVSPQCPEGQWWNVEHLNMLLDDVSSRYKVDADRVYLTGLSMGGFGTWQWAERSPDRFAAIAPMCGGGEPQRADHLKSLPIWVFHGDADHAVPVARSDEMVEALKKEGADVKYTRYKGIGHDCWTESYNNPELYEWFLKHKRASHAERKAEKTTGK